MRWTLTQPNGTLTRRKLARALDEYVSTFISERNFGLWKLSDHAWTNRQSRFELFPLENRIVPGVNGYRWGPQILEYVDLATWLDRYGSSPLHLVSFRIRIDYDLDSYQVVRDEVGMREGRIQALVGADLLDDAGHRHQSTHTAWGRFHLCHAQWMER